MNIYVVFFKGTGERHSWHSYDLPGVYKKREDAQKAIQNHSDVVRYGKYFIKKFKEVK